MKLPYHPYELYEASVQDPEGEMEFFERVYQEQFGKTPRLLREDFCATFRNACQWVQNNSKHEAYAVDLSADTLAFGKAHTQDLSKDQKQRLHVVHSDVMTVDTPPVDILSISNFSIGYIKSRKDMVRYLQNNVRHLKSPGVMVFDVLGGQELSEPQEDKRSFTMPDGKKVTYIWDHDDYNPITGEATFYIHYKFPKKPRFEKVFTYHWRMWNLPELRDCMLEAGFDDVKIYWEEDDENDEGSGYFSEHADADDCPVWIAYVVGIKKA